MDLEHLLIYHPTREVRATPADAGLDYEAVRFGEGGRLHGWFVPGAGPETWLWCHGNAGNIGHRVGWLRRFHDRIGANLFSFDYAGYGQSRGAPSEAQTYRDARAALAYLQGRPDVDPNRLVYFGKSLGGAVATQLATEAPPHRLIVQSTFTSLPALARWHYPWVPVDLLMRSRYASIDKIATVGAPTLIVHGDTDRLVPVDHARRLYTAARAPKRLLIVPGADHHDVLELGGSGYLDALRAFTAGPTGVRPAR